MALHTLENPLYKNQPVPTERTIQGPGKFKLPAGTRVISADNHWDVVEDIFVQRLPEHLKARAPRVWLDKVARVGFADEKGNISSPFSGELLDRILLAANGVAGNWDYDLRNKHLDADGIDVEINFPNAMLFLIGHPDLELREASFRIYNQYSMEQAAKMGGRSYPVAVVPNWWDPAKAESVIQEIVDMGFKTMMLPVKPGNDLNGKAIVYSEPGQDRLMKAIEQSGLPLCFHIGETPFATGRGGWPITTVSSLQPFVPIFAQMIFGGVLDRCPNLQVVFAEGGISWVTPALQNSENVLDYNPYLCNPMPKLRPTEYWKRNMYVTFMTDRLGLSQLDILGHDRVMWAQDYPHSEGTFGFSWPSMQQIVEDTSPEIAKDILGGTAGRVFNI